MVFDKKLFDKISYICDDSNYSLIERGTYYIFETKRSLECPKNISKYYEPKSSFLIGRLWYVSDLQDGLSDLQDDYKNGNF